MKQLITKMGMGACLLSILGLAQTTWAYDKFWNATSGDWGTESNWTEGSYGSGNFDFGGYEYDWAGGNWVKGNTITVTFADYYSATPTTGIWVENVSDSAGTLTWTADGDSYGIDLTGALTVGTSTAGNLSITKGTYTCSGYLYISTGAATSVFGMSGGTMSADCIHTSNATSAKDSTTISGGELTGNYVTAALGESSESTITVSSGKFAAEYNFELAYGTSSTASMTVSGGEVAVNTYDMRVGIGSSSTATLTVSGSGAVNVARNLNIAEDSGSTGTVNLNGGTLTVGTANSYGTMISGTGTAKLIFNGGTLKAGDYAPSDFIGSGVSIEVNSASTLNTNGKTLTIASTSITGSGTLTLTGSGSLTLSATPASTVLFNLQSGTLVLPSDYEGSVSTDVTDYYVSSSTADSVTTYTLAKTASTYTWQGSSGGSWSDTDNWSNSIVPTSVDTVVFPDGASIALAGDSVSVAAITANGDLTFTGYGDIAVTGAVAVESGTLTFTSNTYSNDNAADTYTISLTASSVSANVLSGVANISTTEGVEADGGTFYGSINGTGGLTVNGSMTSYGLNGFTGALSIDSDASLTLVSSLTGISSMFRLDASDSSSIVLDDSNNVTNWTSQVNEYFFTNETSKMTVTSDYFGGKDSVLTSADSLFSSFIIGRYLFPQSFVGAVRVVNLTGAAAALTGAITSDNKACWIGRRQTGSQYNYWAKMSGGNAATTGFWQNGVANVTTPNTASEEILAVFGWNRYANMNYNFVGGSGGSIAIGELIAFDRSEPTIAQLKQIETYLANKWGITSMGYSIPDVPVTLGSGSTLDLGGTSQTVTSLSGSGTVQNGTITVTDPISVESGCIIKVPVGSTCSAADDGTKMFTGTDYITFAQGVASVGTTYYQTVQAAIDALVAGEVSGTLTVYQSATVSVGGELASISVVCDGDAELTVNSALPYTATYDSEAGTLVSTRTAQTYTWNPQEESTDWTSLSNWLIDSTIPVALPGELDTVELTEAGTVTLAADVTVASLTLGGALTISGDYTITVTTSLPSDVNLAGGTLVIPAGLTFTTFTLADDAAVQVDTSSLSFGGTAVKTSLANKTSSSSYAISSAVSTHILRASDSTSGSTTTTTWVLIGATDKTYYWTGNSDGTSWADAGNWSNTSTDGLTSDQIAALDAANEVPTRGYSVVFYNAASVTVSSDAAAYDITFNAAVTLTGNRITLYNGVAGEGQITLGNSAGFKPAYKMTISNPLCITATETYYAAIVPTTSYITTTIAGTVTGESGTELRLGGTAPTYALTGNLSGYYGKLYAVKDTNTRNSIYIDSSNASSANTAWVVYNSAANHDSNNNLLSTGANTPYYFGSLDGTIYNYVQASYKYTSPTVVIGNLGTDCSFTWYDNARAKTTFQKVGSGRMTITPSSSLNGNVAYALDLDAGSFAITDSYTFETTLDAAAGTAIVVPNETDTAPLTVTTTATLTDGAIVALAEAPTSGSTYKILTATTITATPANLVVAVSGTDSTTGLATTEQLFGWVAEVVDGDDEDEDGTPDSYTLVVKESSATTITVESGADSTEVAYALYYAKEGDTVVLPSSVTALGDITLNNAIIVDVFAGNSITVGTISGDGSATIKVHGTLTSGDSVNLTSYYTSSSLTLSAGSTLSPTLDSSVVAIDFGTKDASGDTIVPVTFSDTTPTFTLSKNVKAGLYYGVGTIDDPTAEDPEVTVLDEEQAQTDDATISVSPTMSFGDSENVLYYKWSVSDTAQVTEE